MRARSGLVFALPLLGLVYACEETDTGSSSGSFDGGTGAFDAGASTPDGAPPPSADAAPEAGPTGVIVNVRSNAKPLADAAVILHDATGAVIATQKTDATGRVTAAKAPAMVTVVGEVNGEKALLTYLGVAEGDVLNVEVGALGGEQAPVGSYAVSFTAPAPPSPVAYSVYVNGDCQNGNEGSPSLLTVDLYPSCLRQNNVLYGVVQNGEGVNSHFTFKKGEAPPAANASRAVTLPQWAPAQTTTVTAANVGARVDARVGFVAIADGAPFEVESAVTVGSGATFRWGQGFPDALSARLVARNLDGADGALMVKRVAPGNAIAFDLATGLPAITKVESTGTPRPDVKVTASASLGGSDGGIVSLIWSKTVGNDLNQYRWSFVVPPDATTFKAPALPDTLADLAPPANVVVGAGFFEADVVPGYAQTRALVLPLGGVPPVLDTYATAPLPANGTLRASLFGTLAGPFD